MDAAQREKANKLWFMAQAVMGLPFRTFKHPAFEEAYRFSNQFLGYKLPSKKRLRITLLDANYETVREETEKKMFDHMVWDKITISCDGWTNKKGRPQMNMLHISRHDELAHRHVDESNETKSAVWIAEHITKDIKERGPPNVLQFVADNASANILAGKLVRERYPHIIFGGCVAHGLDLLMEDIGKLPTRHSYDDGEDIRTAASGRLAQRLSRPGLLGVVGMPRYTEEPPQVYGTQIQHHHTVFLR
ncbi:hypothetical protein R1sor_014576 [Riccia sorocarpa]|uniref:DUF659 domain-containing protein n=1 Tax=Riccia sorocarpa TaxID=122646 RepID=A0ABD3HCC5_9MARC